MRKPQASDDDYDNAAESFRRYCAEHSFGSFKQAWLAYDAFRDPNDRIFRTRPLRASCKNIWRAAHPLCAQDTAAQARGPRGGRRVVARAHFHDSVDQRREADRARAARTERATAALRPIIAAGRRKHDEAVLSQLREVRRIAGDKVYFSRSFQKRLQSLRKQR